jgi:alkyldihydroxyacetonephosphate synthase
VLSGGAGGVLAICGFEGTRTAVRRAEVAGVLACAGGEALGVGPGEIWRQGRYRAPYLRDPLLDKGALVETVETAGFWSALPGLKAAVTEALVKALSDQGTPPLVLCHVSHVYETGASLYFTVISAQTDEPIAQWRTAKAAASAAIATAGGTITHHHGVGTDRRPGRGRPASHRGPASSQARTRPHRDPQPGHPPALTSSVGYVRKRLRYKPKSSDASCPGGWVLTSSSLQV